MMNGRLCKHGLLEEAFALPSKMEDMNDLMLLTYEIILHALFERGEND